MDNLTCYLCFPCGHASLWFQGRVLPKHGKPWSLLAAQQLHQHECLNPMDGGRIAYDVGIVNHHAREELRVDDVIKTGGTLCNLEAEIIGDYTGPSPSATSTSPPTLSFTASSLHTDAAALSIAARLFPEISSQLSAAPASVIKSNMFIVEGTMQLSRSMQWKPEWRVDASSCVPKAAVGAGAGHRPSRPRMLTAQDFDSEDDEAELHRRASTTAISATDIVPSTTARACTPPRGSVAELYARDYSGNQFADAAESHAQCGDDAAAHRAEDEPDEDRHHASECTGDCSHEHHQRHAGGGQSNEQDPHRRHQTDDGGLGEAESRFRAPENSVSEVAVDDTDCCSQDKGSPSASRSRLRELIASLPSSAISHASDRDRNKVPRLYESVGDGWIDTRPKR